MAYMKKNFLLALMVLLLLVVSSYARFNMMVAKGKIESICTKDVNHSLCFEILKPTPEIEKLDFSGLAKFVINYLSRYTSDTLNQVKMFEGNTTGADLQTLQLCAELYDDSLFHNDRALKVLASKDYDNLNTEVGFTLAYTDTCNDELITMKPVPQVLFKKNSDINAMSNIILVILECFIREVKIRC
ncbi:unnamed protein product [Eruca vesicaria subsp. sativa]|uniref:Pectinesterase inhibitor domain-containing protein n=1 Tax=Eruca vesicaria subsp. sativa TaxID=29727 RepID=A0ABC8M079_ERUVS|nr:unnamed protein product [Eruca vesicaria subsp. sativa]